MVDSDTDFSEDESVDSADDYIADSDDTTVDWLAVVGIDLDNPDGATNADSGGPEESDSVASDGSGGWLAMVGLDRESRSHSESHPDSDVDQTVHDTVDTSETQAVDEGDEATESDELIEGDKPIVDEEDDEFSLPLFKILLYGFGLVVLYFLANFGDVWFASRADLKTEATTAVVLGAAQYNGEPSDALRGRLDRALELYESETVSLVVVTGGGQTDDITTEAKTGYDYLREAGIPDEQLKLEVQGTTTYESLAATARFLEDESISNVIVVTDPYHARRSTLIANEVGLEADAATTGNEGNIRRLVNESIGVSVGRLITFRRFDAYLN